MGVALAVPAAGTASAQAPAPEVVIRDPSFNWNRLYVGAYGGVWFNYPALTVDTLRAGGVVGRNVTIGDRFMIGAEANAGYYVGSGYPDPVLEIYGLGRAGLRFDRAFVYGSAGFGWDEVFGYSHTLGGGAEFVVNPVMSLRADAQLWGAVGAPFDYLSVTGGFNWYIRR